MFIITKLLIVSLNILVIGIGFYGYHIYKHNNFKSSSKAHILTEQISLNRFCSIATANFVFLF